MEECKIDKQKNKEKVSQIKSGEEDVVVLEIDSSEFEKIMCTLDLFKARN